MILSFRVVLSLEDKAPPEAVTFFNPAFPNGAGLLTAWATGRSHSEALSDGSAGRAQYFDVTPGPGCCCQPLVAGKQTGLQRLCERDVGRVTDREVVAQFPAAGKQVPVRGPLHRYRGKVRERQGGAAGIDRTRMDPPAQDRGDLKIE
jgi:hypothetical protein